MKRGVSASTQRPHISSALLATPTDYVAEVPSTASGNETRATTHDMSPHSVPPVDVATRNSAVEGTGDPAAALAAVNVDDYVQSSKEFLVDVALQLCVSAARLSSSFHDSVDLLATAHCLAVELKAIVDTNSATERSKTVA